MVKRAGTYEGLVLEADQSDLPHQASEPGQFCLAKQSSFLLD